MTPEDRLAQLRKEQQERQSEETRRVLEVDAGRADAERARLVEFAQAAEQINKALGHLDNAADQVTPAVLHPSHQANVSVAHIDAPDVTGLVALVVAAYTVVNLADSLNTAIEGLGINIQKMARDVENAAAYLLDKTTELAEQALDKTLSEMYPDQAKKLEELADRHVQELRDLTAGVQFPDRTTVPDKAVDADLQKQEALNPTIASPDQTRVPDDVATRRAEERKDLESRIEAAKERFIDNHPDSSAQQRIEQLKLLEEKAQEARDELARQQARDDLARQQEQELQRMQELGQARIARF